MGTPYLRILIVDDQPLQRLGVEKILNSHGYFRIAPVDSLDELLILAAQAVDRFDLVIINAAIKGRAQVDLEEFFRNCASIRHVLIYDGQSVNVVGLDEGAANKVVMKVSGPPGSDSIQSLMQLIDLKKTIPTRRKTIGMSGHF